MENPAVGPVSWSDVRRAWRAELEPGDPARLVLEAIGSDPRSDDFVPFFVVLVRLLRGRTDRRSAGGGESSADAGGRPRGGDTEYGGDDDL
jgi:hypothetical protein